MKLTIAAITLLTASIASASTNDTEASTRMAKRAKKSSATLYTTCSKPGTFALTFVRPFIVLCWRIEY